MKRIVKALVLGGICTVMLTGCLPKKVPAGWYEDSVEYYKQGFANGWEGNDTCNQEYFTDSRFGYLLQDLDGDGAEELLIGIIDDAPETKFTDIVIWHRDFGAMRVLSTGDGYYMYLCDDNVIKEDSWYGSQTKTQYMVYDSKENAFPIVDGGGMPKKFELTEFERPSSR